MKSIVFFSLVALFMASACQKDRPEMGDAPSAADALFSYAPSAASPNVIELTAANPTLQCMWDLGNGTKISGSTVSATYPYAGTYTVKLTVYGKGGSNSSTQQIVIANDDLSLLSNPIYGMLTGGTGGLGYKTWLIDSIAVGHMGVGPDPVSALGNVPEWWAAGSAEKAGCGLYDDRYRFYLNGFKFDMVNHGDVYIHNSLSGSFPGSFQNLGDFTAPYTDQLNESWLLTEGADTTITISNNAFIGFYSGVKTYKIISVSDSTLYLQYAHHAGGLLWYLKMKTE